MKKLSESLIQQQCYVWFVNNYGLKEHEPNRCIFFSIPNEIAMGIRASLIELKIPAKYVDRAIFLALKKAKNVGFLPGVSDTIIVMSGKTLYVEFKTLTGTQSEEQKQFQKRVENLGHQYYLVRSLEQFKIIFE